MKTAAATLLAILCTFETARAQDRWTGPDKAKHFGAAAAVAAAGYTLAIPFTRRTRWRIAIGTAAGIGAGAGKEFTDRARGTPSWRDFSWSAAGTATGVFVAWTVDKLAN